jgi:SAM-dependent methyltransferase
MCRRTKKISESHRITDLSADEPHLGYPAHLVVDALERFFSVEMNFSVLDAGCGFGHAACAIAEHFPQSSVQAIDLEPTVVAVGRQRAKRLRVTHQITFKAERLNLENRISPPVDVLIFLAAGEVFQAPATLGHWLQSMGAPNAIALVDRTTVVLPGRERSEREHFNRFRSALGISVDQIGSRTLPLSRKASLRCADVLLESATQESHRTGIIAARQRMLGGERARVVSALFSVTQAVAP